MRLNKVLFLSRLWWAATVVALILPVAVGASVLAQTDDGLEGQAILTIGSKAPALDIETWFSDREGEFNQTTKLEPGKIYLIDFWATWSRASHPWMLKYADLQDRYFDEGLQIIRVSDEDEDSVANFLELDVSGQKETIYAEWTLGYCVTTDPDRSVHEDYLVAAQQANLPVVFIVGRTGLVEWIGNPAKMQTPLKKIIDGKWDRAVFGAKIVAEQRMIKMAAEVRQLLQRGETEEALKLIEKMMVDAPDSKTRAEMAALRLGILMENDGPNIAEAFKEVVENISGNSYRLNELAWSIVTRAQGGKEISSELLEIAAETAKRGVALSRKEGSDSHLGAVLDTYAHLVFMQGDLDKALELQTEATELYDSDDIFEYLDELKNEKSKRVLAEAQTGEPPKEGVLGNGSAENLNSEGSESPKTESPKTEPEETELEESIADPSGIES
jgi:tetratricopeptide (TPR) repeat protein